MWKQKLCLSTSPSYGLPIPEQILLFRQTGYDGFFTPYVKGSLESFAELAAKEGMMYQSVHAPYGHSHDIWHGTREQAEFGIQEYLDCLEETERAGVDLMICHTFHGFEDHCPTAQGLEMFGRLVEAAEKTHVNLAFENVEGEEYLEAVLKAFWSSDHVGYCWDSGHEQCYNHAQDYLARYGSKLLGTHLNDNLGCRDFNGVITWKDDLHLLPGDGIIDWGDAMHKLNREGFNGPLTFELKRPGLNMNNTVDIYENVGSANYITETFRRACKVAAMKIRDAK